MQRLLAAATPLGQAFACEVDDDATHHGSRLE
jgi:hypothetical protein